MSIRPAAQHLCKGSNNCFMEHAELAKPYKYSPHTSTIPGHFLKPVQHHFYKKVLYTHGDDILTPGGPGPPGRRGKGRAAARLGAAVRGGCP